MKRRHAFQLILALSLVSSTPALAQLTVESSTVDGGGGTSTNGSFEVSGTIGQFDAGTLAGGTFDLQSGFWTSENPAVPVELQSFQIVLNRIKKARQSRLASTMDVPLCREDVVRLGSDLSQAPTSRRKHSADTRGLGAIHEGRSSTG